MVTSSGVVPKGLLTFLGFLDNAEFSPWKRLLELNSGSLKTKFAGVSETASDDFFFVCVWICLEKNCLCYPRLGVKDQY